MATKTELKPAKESAEGDGKKKKSKKKLIIIVVAVLVVGGGGYYMFGMGSSTPPKPVAGVVVPLDPITINLAGGHFLKLDIALQATKTAKEVPDGSKALDIAIEIFSNRTVAELDSTPGRDKYKKELTEKVVEAYTEKKVQAVMDVYITEFVMQ